MFRYRNVLGVVKQIENLNRIHHERLNRYIKKIYNYDKYISLIEYQNTLHNKHYRWDTFKTVVPSNFYPAIYPFIFSKGQTKSAPYDSEDSWAIDNARKIKRFIEDWARRNKIKLRAK